MTHRVKRRYRQKYCPGCDRNLPRTLDYWGRNRTTADGWQSRCKMCSTASVRASQQAHPEVTRRSRRAAGQRRRERQQQYIRKLRSEGVCADCGQNPGPETMDFDHLPEFTKVKDISSMVGGSWRALEAELAKCDLICKTCHRTRTNDRAGHRGAGVLTQAEREEIRRRYKNGKGGISQAALAAHYLVTQPTISHVIHELDAVYDAVLAA